MRKFLLIVFSVLILLIPTVAFGLSDSDADMTAMAGTKAIKKATLEKTSFIYDGNEQIPVVKTVNGKKNLDEGEDYVTVLTDKTGKPIDTAIDAGTYYLVVCGINEYSGEAQCKFKINPAEQDIKVTTSAKTIFCDKSPATINAESLQGGKITCTIKSGGKYGELKPMFIGDGWTLQGKKAGKIKLKFTAEQPQGNENYEKTSLEYTITVKKPAELKKSDITVENCTFNGKLQTPKVSVNGISEDQFTVDYEDNIKVGKAKATVTIKSNCEKYRNGSKTQEFEILPPNTTIKSLSPTVKGFTVQWERGDADYTAGYTLYYSTDADMSKAKSVTIKDETQTEETITGLSTEKTYYIQISAYAKINGKKYSAIPGEPVSVTTFDEILIGATSSDGWTNYGAIKTSVSKGGGKCVALPKVTNIDEALFALESSGVSGMLIPGGGDINPACYGEEVTYSKVNEFRDAKDTSEIAYFRAAMELDMPVLGICRGQEMINVASGGGLIQDVQKEGIAKKSHGNGVFHDAKIYEGTLLYGIMDRTNVRVNSYHHQAPNPEKLGENIRVSAVSEDGVIESIERMDKTFVVGTLFHIEQPNMRNKGWDKVFRALTDESCRYYIKHK